MRTIRLVPAALALALVPSACFDEPSKTVPAAKKTADYVKVDPDRVCRIFTMDCPRKTGETYEACVKIYEAMRVSAECQAILDRLSCDTTQTELAGCWPDCSHSVAECDGPHIIECSTSGRTYTYDCDGVCATQNRTWSGTCAASYKGQTSPNPTCWCD